MTADAGDGVEDGRDGEEADEDTAVDQRRGQLVRVGG